MDHAEELVAGDAHVVDAEFVGPEALPKAGDARLER